jgi:tetratricopeptide (TPR) repeat protein
MFRRGVHVDEVEALVPDQPGALLLAASAAFEAGHSAAAEAWFERVLQADPDNVAARLGLVEALLAQKRYDAVLAESRSGVDARFALNELFVHAARADAQALAAVLAEAPIGEPERLIFTAWRQAIEGETVQPLPIEVLPVAASLLEALLKLQEFDAFQTLHGIYAQFDIAPAVRSEVLAAIYFRRGFLVSAADEWVSSLQAQPAAAPLIGLAHVAVARGLRDDALVFCDEALTLEPGSADASRLRETLLAAAA